MGFAQREVVEAQARLRSDIACARRRESTGTPCRRTLLGFVDMNERTRLGGGCSCVRFSNRRRTFNPIKETRGVRWLFNVLALATENIPLSGLTALNQRRLFMRGHDNDIGQANSSIQCNGLTMRRRMTRDVTRNRRERVWADDGQRKVA